MDNTSARLSRIQQWVNDNKIDKASSTINALQESVGGTPLAITGLSGYFPGADDIEQFWSHLDADTSLITQIPEQRKRWYQGAHSERYPDWTVSQGGFIPDICGFDPEKFGILPMEAEEMDPRQRLLLMSTYHTLEDAEIDPNSLKKSKTGVFIGCEKNEYATLMTRHGYKPDFGLSQADSMIANRISYQFDFAGPSELVNATCAGFAVALHRASLALRAGLIDRAIVGAANLILVPDVTNQLQESDQLTVESIVKSFSENGTGFIRAEGVGTILLERLDDVEAAQRPVYAVVKNTQVNFNGQGGISMASPNTKAHTDLIKDCYRDAGIDPRQVSYVEAQGMGSPVADIAEWTAINSALSQLCEEQGLHFDPGFCQVSTLKPLCGHMHAASSLGALLKVIRSLQTQKIHKILGFETINEYCDTQGTPCRIASETQPWPSNGGPRLAAVHSYGSGGNNAHILIQEYAGKHRIETDRKSFKDAFKRRPLWFKTTQTSSEVVPDYQHVLASIGELLNIDNLDETASKLPFTDIGLDSLSVAAFIKRLQAEYHVTLRRSDVFSYTTPAALAEKIANVLQTGKQSFTSTEQSAPTCINTDEDIAIIGMDIKAAGVDDLQQFWMLLREGRSTVASIPEARRVNSNVKIKTTLGGFMERIDEFDPLFFNVSPRESHAMDPHHRMLLQSAWRAIEDSGYNPESWKNGRHGIFIGMEESDYPITDDSSITSVHTGTAPARIGYFLDTKGPLLSIGTACSSSLVAVHYARKSILTGDCELALASGCNLICQPERMLKALTRMGDMLSPNGTCYAFDNRANGMVVGEACATVVLKRYSKAVKDGDAIYATIKGCDINYDGKTNGLTAPSGVRQSELYAQVYKQSGVNPSQIGYIVSHGTGTMLGDPVECNALIDAFSSFSSASTSTQHCALTSSKTNIGHTQAAAGIVNLINAALSLKHKEIPPTLNYEQPNEDIDFVSSPFYVNTRRKSWDADTRYAAVSSFGHTGTNAHLVLQNHDMEKLERPAYAPKDGLYLIVLSTKNKNGLKEAARNLLTQGEPEYMQELTFTLQTGRAALSQRLGLLVTDWQELKQKLTAYLTEQETHQVYVVDLHHAKENTEFEELEPSVNKTHALLAQWLQGQVPNWLDLYAENIPNRIHLSCYPFEKEHYWLDAPKGDIQAQPLFEAETVDTKAIDKVLTYKQAWQVESLLTEGHKKPTKLVCVVPRGVTAEAEFGVLAEQVDYYRPEHSDVSQHQQDFQSLGEQHGAVDTLMCLVEPVSSAQTLFALFKGLSLSGLSVNRMVMVSGFRNGLELSHTDALVAFCSSLHLTFPGMNIAVIGCELDSENYWSELLKQTSLIAPELGSDKLQSVIFKQGQRHILKTVPTVTQQKLPALKQGGNYLITGGMGGLGLLFADYLCANYDAHVILVGRSTLTGDKESQLKALAKNGGKVTYLQGDVSQASQMQDILAQCNERSIDINGILHTAGTQTTQTLVQKSAEEFYHVLAPKVIGTQVLDQVWYKVYGKKALDFMVYFSSSAAVLGDFGSCDYALANRFQMAYADYRNTQVEEGVCSGKTFAICWPVWQDGGMTRADVEKEQATQLYLSSSGQTALQTEYGIKMFEQLLEADPGAYLVMSGYPDKVDALLGLAPNAETDGALRHATETTSSKGRRLEMKGLSVELCVLWELRAGVTQVLGVRDSQLNNDVNLADFGFDSITLAEFANYLSKLWSINISPALFFGHANLQSLCQYFMQEHTALMQNLYVRKTDEKQQTPQASQAHVSRSISRSRPYESKQQEVAIIGMSGRVPSARNVDEMWQYLSREESAVSRISVASLRQRDQVNVEGESEQSWWCGVMPGAAEFDPLFFEISPREAQNMDPRQRHLLQESWKALEDAGYGPKHLKKHSVGTFVGAEEGEYGRHSSDVEITANHNGILASRLAYFLDLSGPVLAINTACSSGLVAAHQACSSLRNGECDTALAAGVSMQFSTEGFEIMNRSGMLSEDGTCYTFDKRANGMVPGEAVVVLVLKLLADAEADGDPIQAVIRASGMNYDGKTNGITAPNGVAQTALIKKVHEGIDPEHIDYIVTHGTGTRLGDPVEINALFDAFKHRTDKSAYCALTSTKTNFGHTFAASGLLSAVSLIQAFNQEKIPASLHCEQENDYINWELSPFYVNKQAKHWPAKTDEPRLGAVSAFGMSGTNAHMILADYPQHVCASNTRPSYVLALSAKSEEALNSKIQELLNALQKPDMQHSLEAISYTLLCGRHHFEYRTALIVEDEDDAIYSLQLALSKGQNPRRFAGKVILEFKGQKTIRQHAQGLLEKSGTSMAGEDYQDILSALGDYYCQGYDLDWSCLYPASIKRISLPTYPFAREEYWVGTSASQTQSTSTSVLHPLVQQNVSTLQGLKFKSIFSGKEFFFDQHKVHGRKVLPGVSYLEMARAAYAQASGHSEFIPMRLQQVLWLRPMSIENQAQDLYLEMTGLDDHQWAFQVYADMETGNYAQGRIQPLVNELVSTLNLSELKAQMTGPELLPQHCYSVFSDMGLNYGERFQGLRHILTGHDQVLARVELTPIEQGFVMHPGLMDAALQASLGLNTSAQSGAYLPFALEQLDVLADPGTQVWVWLRLASGASLDDNVLKLDIDMFDDAGHVSVRMRGFSTRVLQPESNVSCLHSLRGDEYFIEDHGGLLPGVMSIEWARSAWIDAHKTPNDQLLGFKDVVWNHPLVVEQGGVDIQLDIHNLNYSLRVDDQTFARGTLAFKPQIQNPRLSIDDIRAACNRHLNTQDCTEFFGDAIGPRFLAIQALAMGEDQALAQLVLHPDLSKDIDPQSLQPALINGAILASIIWLSNGQSSAQPMLPYSLDELWIRQSLPKKVHAYIRTASSSNEASNEGQAKLDIQILSQAGDLLVEIKGLTLIRAERPAKGTLVFAKPQWQEQALTVNETLEHSPWFILAQTDSELDNELRSTWPDSQIAKLNVLDEKQALHHIFSLIKGWMAEAKAGQSIILLAPNNLPASLTSAWAGLLRTVVQEKPSLNVKLLTYSDSSGLIQKVNRELSASSVHTEVAYEQLDSRHIKVWETLHAEHLKNKDLPINVGSLIWVTGGLGGIGFQIAKYLGRHYQARLILSGRSDSKSVTEQLDELDALGIEAHYLQGDVADEAQTRDILALISENYGQLNGIIHSAGIIRDAYIVKKTERELAQVLAPKVSGVLALDEATKGLELDFFLLFSSLSGAFGNAGQADYAMANGFMDGFVQMRNQKVTAGKRWGRTLSINWPLWKEGGMSVSEQDVELMSQATGMQPMPFEMGVRAMELGLQSGESQLLVIYGNEVKIREKLNPKRNQAAPEKGITVANLESIHALLVDIVVDLQKLDPKKIELDMALSKYGFNSIDFTQFASRLNTSHNLDLMPTLFFEHSTLRAVAKHLADTYPDAFFQTTLTQVPLSPVTAQVHNVRNTGWKASSPFPSEQVPSKPVPNETARSDIAIIGMSGRFPQSQDLATFWENLEANRDLVTEVPADRWDWQEYYGNPHETPGKTKVKWGGFMQDVDCFDPLFFGISPREAQTLDPQFRLFLETVWTTIEDAGYSASALAGSNTGVFVGVSTSEYKDAWLKYSKDKFGVGDPSWLSHFALANRVSYVLDLHGPSEPIDTACSSSLVAIHRAVESMRSGSCEAAIVGGVNVIANPGIIITAGEAGILSEDGRCKTFDNSANGYGRGEGVGTVMLKFLAEAESSGDRIYGVIRGSAENHGGKATSPTAPNPVAQQALIVKAYTDANIDPETLGYIETHGTGTRLGDPIEINGLKSGFETLYQQQGKQMTSTAYCALGSVKTNIGHLEAAAGISGILKVLLMFQHQKIPGNPHLKETNPYLKLADSPFYLVKETQDWPALIDDSGHTVPRRAGVSSFGIGGANAHIVLEEYAQPEIHNERAEEPEALCVFVLSARKLDRLQLIVRRLLDYLDSAAFDAQNARLADIAYTLQLGREAMDVRVGFIASSIDELKQKLGSYLSGQLVGVFHGSVKANKDDLDELADENEWQDIVSGWLESGKPSKLPALWVKGLSIDWSVLYTDIKPRRIGLPTYPFTRDSFWLVPAKPQKEQAVTASVLHPLVHHNTSDIHGLSFSSCFSGGEFFFDDHKVAGEKMLPGVAYLEIARAATAQVFKNSALELTQIVWLRPLVFNNSNEDIMLNTRLHPRSATALDFEIYSIHQKQEHIHCQGKVCISTMDAREITPLNLPLCLQEHDGGSLSREQCYQAFEGLGINYGPSHRGVQILHLGHDKVLAKLALPEILHNEFASYVLHPSLLDSALQATLGLSSDRELGLPFELESLDIIAPCTHTMWVCIGYATRPDGKTTRLNLDMYSDTGQVCVRFRGFCSRVLGSKVSGTAPAKKALEIKPNSAPAITNLAVTDTKMPKNQVKAEIGLLMLAPEWQPTTSLTSAKIHYASHKVLLCVSDSHITTSMIDVADCELLQATSTELAAGFTQQAHALFEQIKATLHTKPKQDVLLQLVVAGKYKQALSAALVGLLKTARLENPRFIGQLIQVSADETQTGLNQKLLESAQCSQDTHIRYDAAGRSILAWQELVLEETMPAMPWKEGGVYLITGGAGGLGLIFATEIAEKTQNVRLILTGRSIVNAVISQALEKLQMLGAHVIYRQLDVTQRQSIDDVISELKPLYGMVNGVMHCAGVLRDSYIVKKSTQDLDDVLAPKVQGTVNLDLALANHPLDFFVLFSSTAAVLGNPGQSDYVTANAFMDGFAHYRQGLVAQDERYGRSLAINWPLWKDGGMHVDPAFEAMMFQSTGMIAMRKQSGLKAFYHAVARDETQLLVMEGDVQVLRQALEAAHTTGPEQPHSEQVVDLVGLKAQIQRVLLNEVSDLLSIQSNEIDTDLELTELGFDSILTTSFANKLNREYALELMPTVFFEYPTVSGLSEYLLTQYQDVFSARFGDFVASSVFVNVPVERLEPTPSIDPVALLPASTLDTSVLHEAISQLLLKEVSELLNVEVEDIEVGVELTELGFDSILTTSFANKLNRAYELKLMPTVFFEYPRIDALTIYLAQEYKDTFAKQLDLVQTSQVSRALEVAPLGVRQDDRHKTPNDSFYLGKVEPSAESNQHLSTTPNTSPSTGPNQRKVPVAIIGMSGSFPMADDLDAYWENLIQGKDCISQVPEDRWLWRDYLSQVSEAVNKDSIQWGGFISGMASFDPLFFGISPGEADSMDPQQRLLMTYVWKAIEDAGYSANSLAGSTTGIFVGTGSTGYSGLVVDAKIPVEGFTSTGLVPSVGPNRMSYFLDIHGPSEPIETACSSSLIAIHRGVLAIQEEDCGMVLVGGVNTLVTPDVFVSFCKAGMLAQDGRCKTFSSQANGYVRGEGVGMLLLKPLPQAQLDGDHIYGVIRGSAENHGGRGSSLTAPNPKAQVALLKRVYQKSGIDPANVSYVEAHGTGTELGDPIEVSSLKTAFSEQSNASFDVSSCGLGSVKSNIGHLEMAAGIAGVIKVLLQMKHKTLVKTLHADALNPYIDLKGSPFYLVNENRSWERATNAAGEIIPLIAGVSSFGFGGANAHVVLEEYKEQQPLTQDSGQAHVILLSAKDEKVLIQQVADLNQYLNSHKNGIDFSLANMAYTLQVGRDAMKVRLGWIVKSVDELQNKLTIFLGDPAKAEQAYRGQVGTNKDLVAQFAVDEELREAVSQWAAKGKYTRLLDLWCKGLVFDWAGLYQGHKLRRLSLPGYPFNQQKHWISTTPVSAESKAVLHPLLHENTSNMSSLSYSSKLNAQSDFVIGEGERQLSRLALLEMIRAAITGITDQALALTLRNIQWGQPLILDANGKDIHIAIFPEPDTAFDQHGVMNYEIYAESEGSRSPTQIFAQGSAKLQTHSRNDSLNLAKLQADLNVADLDGKAFDRQLQVLNANPQMASGIERIQVGENQLLAEFSFPNIWFEQAEDLLLHPTLLQSVLFASLGFSQPRESENHGCLLNTYYPLQLLSLEIFSACTPNLKVWMRLHPSTPDAPYRVLDVDIFDESGKLCMRLLELTLPLLGKRHGSPISSASDELENYLKSLICKQLKISDDMLSAERELEELGMDSVASIELLNQLKKRFPDVSRSLFMEFKNVREICEYLRDAFTIETTGIETTGTETTGTEAASPSVETSSYDLSFINHDWFGSLQSWRQAANEERKIKAPTLAQGASIIGMAGIFPQADNVTEFWHKLNAGESSMTLLSNQRRHLMAMQAEEPGASRVGGYLDGVEYFDHKRFRVSHKEAKNLDPQLRKLLEVSWQAISDAGYTLKEFREQRTGLFVATRGHSGYQDIRAKRDPQDALESKFSAEQTSAYANRLSNILNLHGPSEIIETGCSSFLVAIKHAITSIKQGRCQQAIVATAELGLSPYSLNRTDNNALYSSHSYTHSFGHDSDGYIKSEVIGAIVLKSEEKAAKDKDSVYANVKGVGVCHGGKAPLKWYSPNIEGQKSAIEEAFIESGFDPASVSYIEPEANGSQLGDASELVAIQSVYGAFVEKSASSIAIGSLKPLGGHAETASTFPVLAKILLSMRHQQLAKIDGLGELNESIKMVKGFELLRQDIPWPRSEQTPRRSAIHSMSIGGVNAHLLLEEGRSSKSKEACSLKQEQKKSSRVTIFALSEKNASKLKELVAHYQCFLEEADSYVVNHGISESDYLQRLEYTLLTGREQMPCKLLVLAHSVKDIQQALSAWVRNESHPFILVSKKRDAKHVEASMQQEIVKWIADQDVKPLASVWLDGEIINWAALYPDGGNKLHLPANPLEKVFCWHEGFEESVIEKHQDSKSKSNLTSFSVE